MNALPIEIWSDIACPWCWIGKRRLEEAIASFGSEVAITWRPFELDPSAPQEAPERVDYVDRLATKYRTTPDQAQEMIDRMVGVGRECGLSLRFDRIRPSNTFDAHRLLAWARTSGRQTVLKERLFSAYLHEGSSVSDRNVICGLAAEVGLDREGARAVLEGNTNAAEVREEERLGVRLGVTGVPFFVLGTRFAVSGAQPAAVLLEAMRRAGGESLLGPS